MTCPPCTHDCEEGRACLTSTHRVVLLDRDDPAPTDDSGHPVGWAVLLFAIACAIAWVFIRVKLNLPS
jgi:hypothetical protein